MAETVCIPREEYQFLADCKKILEMEADTDLTPETLKELERAEKDIHQGKGKTFTSKKKLQNHFEAM